MKLPSLARPFAPFFITLSLALSAGFGISHSQARAETTASGGATAITSIPCTLSASGSYYLAQDFTVTTNNSGIIISASDVSIDFNGHTLAQNYASNLNCIAVYVSPNSENVSISNGTLTGFFYGVVFEGGANNGRAENMCLSGLTYGGMICRASNVLIHRCRVLNTGGSPYDTGSAVGISIFPNGGSSQGVRIIDCDIAGISSSVPWWGQYGILAINNAAATDVLIEGNRVGGCYNGISYNSWAGSATGKYRNNICAADVGAPYSGGTNAGGNN